VNAQYPSPVNARHVVGMYVPFPILNALAHVVPDRVVSEGSGAVWTVQIQGKDEKGKPFTSSMFNYSGGMGARAHKPGLSAICYPTGVAAVPVEVWKPPIRSSSPARSSNMEPAARANTWGDGQRIGFRMRTNSRWLLNTIPSRLREAPQGLAGGMPGAAGRSRSMVNPLKIPASGKCSRVTKS
jgi:N-methylhydantoinase B